MHFQRDGMYIWVSFIGVAMHPNRKVKEQKKEHFFFTSNLSREDYNTKQNLA